MAGIQDVRELDSDIQGSWIWEVEIEGIAGATDVPEQHTFQAQSVTIPEMSLGVVEIPFKSNRTYFRGRDDTDQSLTINFFDTEDHTVYEFLWNWMNNINAFGEDTGGGENKDDYKATIKVRTQGKDEETDTGEWVFKGCWLNSIGSIELDYESDEAMTVEATLQFDFHEYESQ